MFTILKNVKYLLFFSLLSSIKVEANQHAKIALHGGYTFETSLEQKATAVYLSFFNNSEKPAKNKRIIPTGINNFIIHL